MYKKTTEELTKSLDYRIAHEQAEIAALKAIKINPTHKTLTNRGVEGGTISTSSYSMNGSKELRFSYTVKTEDGHSKYESDYIDLSEYTGEVVGCIKQQRTITPQQAIDRINQRIGVRTHDLELIMDDRKKAAKLVAEYNKIADQVNAFQDKLTWASRSVLKIQ